MGRCAYASKNNGKIICKRDGSRRNHCGYTCPHYKMGFWERVCDFFEALFNL